MSEMINYFDNCTLNFIINKMTGNKKVNDIYFKYLSNIRYLKSQFLYDISSHDVNFELITKRNILNLLCTVKKGKTIFNNYIKNLEYLTNYLLSTDDYLINIIQFLNEKDKINLCFTNKYLNIFIKNSKYCPLYFKLNINNINDILNDSYTQIILYFPNIFKQKINQLQIEIKKKCTCKYEALYNYFDIMPNIEKACNNCKILELYGLKYIYGSLYREDTHYNFIYWFFEKYSCTKETLDLSKQQMNDSFNKFINIYLESKIYEISLSKVSSNHKFYSYDSINQYYNKLYTIERNNYLSKKGIYEKCFGSIIPINFLKKFEKNIGNKKDIIREQNIRVKNELKKSHFKYNKSKFYHKQN